MCGRAMWVGTNRMRISFIFKPSHLCGQWLFVSHLIYLSILLTILYLLRNVWRNTSFQDTCNPVFCVTVIFSIPKICAYWAPKLPRNPPLTPAIPSWSIWNEVFRPLCWALCPLWPLALSSCSTGHSPCLFTCPQWHGYCKVFVLFWLPLQGLLCNSLLARGFPPSYFLFSSFLGIDNVQIENMVTNC